MNYWLTITGESKPQWRLEIQQIVPTNTANETGISTSTSSRLIEVINCKEIDGLPSSGVCCDIIRRKVLYWLKASSHPIVDNSRAENIINATALRD